MNLMTLKKESEQPNKIKILVKIWNYNQIKLH